MAKKKKAGGTKKTTSSVSKPTKKTTPKGNAKSAAGKGEKRLRKRKSGPSNSPRQGQSDSSFPIVGIGASAGGLAALKSFFAKLPADSGLAYVVVVHLSPEHKSHLAELLQPHVKMPVQQVSETTELQPNHVYVIPPNANLDTIDTHLRLTELEKRRQERAPIDHFFRTLAKTHDGEAIGVILTGTGSDGTLGLREIKERGGLTVVQDPNDAEYDGMPQSAVSTGLVDLILPLEEIPDAILNYTATEPKLPLPTDGDELDVAQRRLLHKTFAQIRACTGRDFSRYKRSTILRRIQRRMQLRHIEEFETYVTLLREQTEEVSALADDLLITVTSFFRDSDVFAMLEKDVIPQLFEGKDGKESIRVWSVGCATGEEAYSLAMLLLEEASRRDAFNVLQVFASDLHERSLTQAREGFYPGDIATDVSPERLKRFFTKEDGGYRIRKEVRDMVVFAPHNLLGDPPFSRLNFLSCRNLLIYLQRDVQQDVIELFHYALQPEAYLLLGTSETLESADLFHLEDKKHCLYHKRNVPGPEPRLPVFPVMRALPLGESGPHQRPVEPVAFSVLHQRMVERFAPPSMLISPDDKVVHLSEHAGRYLVHSGGEPTMNVFKLIRQELRMDLRTALQAARDEHRATTLQPRDVRFNGESAPVILHVRPALEPPHEGFVLVIFDERGPAQPLSGVEESTKHRGKSSSAATDAAADDPDAAYVQQLERELNQGQQRLQAIIEEYETGQEELKASNEELQSANEELRSTLEELETSKEELQSMNEELQTVNQENRHKVTELAQLSGDLHNLLASTDIATLFLDRELRIMRFTPKVSELFNVRMNDRGRPISDFTHCLGYDALQSDAQRVLDKLIPIQREIQDDQGFWYLARILPYRDSEDRIAGVVLTFVDISERKSREEQVHRAKNYSERIVETLHEPLLILRPDLTVARCNPAFYKHFQVSPEQTCDRKIYELANGQWNIHELRTLLEDVLPDSHVCNDYEVSHDFEDLGHRVMLLNARRLDHPQLILLGIRDITKAKAADDALRASEERYRSLFNSIDEGFCVFEMIYDDQQRPVDYRFLEVNPAFERHTGLADAVGKTVREMVPDHEQLWFDRYGRVAETGEPLRMEERAEALGRWYDIYAFRMGEPGSRTVAALFSDISERKQAEDALRESEARMRQAAEAARFGSYSYDIETEAIHWSPELYNIHGIDPDDGINQQKLLGMIHPADRQRYQDFVAQAIASPSEKEPYSGEFRIIRPDGEIRWMGDRGRILFEGEDQHRRPIRAAGMVIDITQRKLAEEALRESEERVRLATDGARIGIWEWEIDTGKVVWDEIERELVGCCEDKSDFAIEDFHQCTHPDDREIIDNAVARAMEGEAYECEFRVVPDGKTRWLVGKGEVYRDESGRPVRMRGVNFDITPRKELESRLRDLNESLEDQVHQRTEMLRMLQDVTQSANEADTVTEAMHEALERISQYNGWQIGHVWRLDDVAGDFVNTDIWHMSAGAEQAIGNIDEFRQICASTRFALGEPIIGAVAASSGPYWIDDIASSKQWKRGDAKRLGLHAAIAFPITAAGRPVAVIEFFSDRPATREERFLEIMPAVGIQLGHVIERKQLERDIADAVTEQQRYFGTQLHDGIQQQLTGITMLGENLRSDLSGIESPLAENMGKLIEHVKEAQNQIRLLSHGLMPVDVDAGGLSHAVERLVDDWNGLSQAEFVLHCPQEVRLEDNNTATQIYHIAQEAMQNAMKHGKPSRIDVTLSRNHSGILLEVADNGGGMPEPATKRSGAGLRTMQYRANLIGAQFALESQAGCGVTVRCHLPSGIRPVSVSTG